MPRKKRTIVEETLPDNPVNENEDIADIICVVSKVYKLSVTGKSFCFQTTEPVDEVSIQTQYPSGGKFVVQEYNTMNQVINTTHIDIEPKSLTVVNSNGGDIRSQMLLDELAFTRNMMLQLIQGLVANKGQTAATPLGELAQAMQVMHQLGSANNPVDLIVKGMELGMKSNGSGPDWKAQLAEAAVQIAPTVVQTIGAVRQQVQPQQGQPMLETNPAAMIKQGINWLKPKIIGGMSTDLAIGWVIQNSNDPFYQSLLATAIQGDINSFMTIDPELGNEPYRGWFTAAITQIKEWYALQSADQTDHDGRNGNDPDLTDDENVSAGQSTIRKIG